MNDAEFKALAERIKKGETLSTLDRFLYERERARREVNPNPLQRMIDARQRNPLIDAPAKGARP